METDNQYDELLFRYLSNEVNTEERRFVEEWINSAKENHRHFDNLKNVWQLYSVKHSLDYVLDEMDVHEKWDQFKQTIAEKETGKRSEEEYLVEAPPERSTIYRWLVQAAIAAAVILAVGIGWKFLIQNNPDTPLAKNTVKKTYTSTFVERHEVNTTGKDKRIQLPDGSLVVLADKSEISYYEPFKNKRDIGLVGKGYFKVAKDSTKPFTVASGDVSTTALGTEFTVTAFEKDKTIIVRLYEGKVVIRESRRLLSDIYLVPGQEFIYDRQPVTKLKTFKLKESVAPEQILRSERLQDDPNIPEDDAGPWYMFNNQQLAQVLDQFAALYNVKIIYDKADVQNIYFTGKYNRLEPLEIILRRIGKVNNLTITKTDSAFIISK